MLAIVSATLTIAGKSIERRCILCLRKSNFQNLVQHHRNTIGTSTHCKETSPVIAHKFTNWTYHLSNEMCSTSFTAYSFCLSFCLRFCFSFDFQFCFRLLLFNNQIIWGQENHFRPKSYYTCHYYCRRIECDALLNIRIPIGRHFFGSLESL